MPGSGVLPAPLAADRVLLSAIARRALLLVMIAFSSARYMAGTKSSTLAWVACTVAMMSHTRRLRGLRGPVSAAAAKTPARLA